MTPEDRLAQLHLQLPTPAKPVAKYKMAVTTGKLLFVSGHGPTRVTPNTPVQGKGRGNQHAGNTERPAWIPEQDQTAGENLGLGQL